MEYEVRHRTTYRYLHDVSYSCHLAHLTPRETPAQQVERSETVLSVPAARRRCEPTTSAMSSSGWLSISRIRCSRLSPNPASTLNRWPQTRPVPCPGRRSRPCWKRPGKKWRVTPRNTSSTSPLVGSNDIIAAYGAKSFPAGRSVIADGVRKT